MTDGSIGHWRGKDYVQWGGTDRPKGYKKPKGEPEHPHSYYKWSYHRKNPNRDFWGSGWSSMDGKLRTREYLDMYYPNVCNGLQNFVVRKLTDAVSQQQYLADLYEAKTAVDLVTVKLGQLLKLTKSLKKLPRELLKFKGYRPGGLVTKPKGIRGKGPRKNRKKAKHDLSVVPAEWLTYWFGIAPTVGSVSGLAEAFNVPFDPFEIRGKSPITDFPTRKDADYEETCQAQISFRGWIQILNPNVGILDRMGLRSVASTVWEVAPWSWAIDYFGNMGELFSNFDGLFKNVRIFADSWTWRITNQWRQLDPFYPGNGWELGTGFVQQRMHPLPTTFLPEFNIDISVKRMSYLLSAISLTLKGKMS